jgi:hypothetical protein
VTPPDERWIGEALHHFRREASSFIRTFWAFLAGPADAARAWQRDDERLMNPMGFASISAGVYWGVAAIVAAVWPVPSARESNAFVDQLTGAVGPYVQYGLLGLSMHVALRALGSRRAAAGSVAIALFTGGSTGMITGLILSSTASWIAHSRGTNQVALTSGDTLAAVFLTSGWLLYALVCLALSRAMLGLHHTSAWKVTASALLAVVVTALVFGMVLTTGNYGWRPYLSVGLGAHELGFGFRG